MELPVDPMTLESALSANQPDAGQARTLIGLLLLTLAFSDAVSIICLGYGPTAAIAGYILRNTQASPIMVLGGLPSALDGFSFFVGFRLLIGTRWHSLFRRGIVDLVGSWPVKKHAGHSEPTPTERPPRSSAADPQAVQKGHSVNPQTIFSLGTLNFGISLALGSLIALQMNMSGGLQAAFGSPIAETIALLTGLEFTAIYIGVSRTVPIERHCVIASIALTILAMVVFRLGTLPLSNLGIILPQQTVFNMVKYASLGLGAGLTTFLYLGFETGDATLTLVLNWDPDTNPALPPYFQRNREESTIHRRSILKILTNGRQLLVITKTPAVSEMQVLETSKIDKVHAICLNDVGVAILDFKKMAELMSPSKTRSTQPEGIVSYPDTRNIVSFDIKVTVVSSTAGLPPSFTISERTFNFLRDFVFASNALPELIDTVIHTAVDEMVMQRVNQAVLGAFRADWQRSYHALDFVDPGSALHTSHPLDRTPGELNIYLTKINKARELEEQLGRHRAELITLQGQLSEMGGALRSIIQAAVPREIDRMILQHGELLPREKREVRAVTQIFNIVATARPTPNQELELDKLAQEAKETYEKLASDLKLAREEVIKAQGEVSEIMKILLAKPMLSAAERRFLESWKPGVDSKATRVFAGQQTLDASSNIPSTDLPSTSNMSTSTRQRF